MNNFFAGLLAAPVVFAMALVFWMFFFDAVDKHMVEYQECGGVYCSPQDPVQ